MDLLDRPTQARAADPATFPEPPITGRRRAWLASGLVLVVALMVWEAITRLRGISALVLPGPLRVLTSLSDNLRGGFLWPHIATTLAEVALGFAVGAALGLALAAWLFHWPAAERVVRPYIIASQAMPKLALAPIFVLWFGFGLTPKVLITALIVFFPLFEGMLAGLAAPGRVQLDLFRALRASRWQTFWRLRLPSALPYLFASLRVAVILSVVGAVVSEYVGANRGLGAVIIAAQGTLDTPLMFAVFVLLTLIGLALYGLVVMIERWALSRYPADAHR